MRKALSVLYGWGVKIHQGLYQYGILNRYRFQTPVIGVGNVECGGAGKTPTVCDLAKRFLSEGMSVVVVVSGYKKSSPQKMRVMVPAQCQDIFNAAQILGDEGAEICDELSDFEGAWVVSSNPKWKGVAWAQQALKPQVVLVDDALQHYPLICEKMMIVATHPKALLYGKLLPEGRLREKLFPGREKDIELSRRWVWSRAEPEFVSPEQVSWSRDFQSVEQWGTAQRHPLDFLHNKTFNIITAIAHPEQFIEDCRALGVKVGCVKAFKDHHVFSENEVKKIIHAMSPDSDWLTTVKDAVKLKAKWFDPSKLFVLRCVLRWGSSFNEAVWPWLKQGVVAL